MGGSGSPCLHLCLTVSKLNNADKDRPHQSGSHMISRGTTRFSSFPPPSAPTAHIYLISPARAERDCNKQRERRLLRGRSLNKRKTGLKYYSFKQIEILTKLKKSKEKMWEYLIFGVISFLITGNFVYCIYLFLLFGVMKPAQIFTRWMLLFSSETKFVFFPPGAQCEETEVFAELGSEAVLPCECNPPSQSAPAILWSKVGRR